MNNLSYSRLLTAIPSYQEQRGADFIAHVPMFISLAENRLATEMKQQGFQAVVTFQLPLDGVMEKPAWWKETISLSYKNAANRTVPLLPRALQYCQNYWPDSGATDEPRFYADYNVKNFLIVPTPPAAYDGELVYYARLDPLSADNDSNWMTMNAPQALFAACMAEANVYLKNDGGYAKWNGIYANARDALIEENKARLADKSVVVVKA